MPHANEASQKGYLYLYHQIQTRRALPKARQSFCGNSGLANLFELFRWPLPICQRQLGRADRNYLSVVGEQSTRDMGFVGVSSPGYCYCSTPFPLRCLLATFFSARVFCVIGENDYFLLFIPLYWLFIIYTVCATPASWSGTTNEHWIRLVTELLFSPIRRMQELSAGLLPSSSYPSCRAGWHAYSSLIDGGGLQGLLSAGNEDTV